MSGVSPPTPPTNFLVVGGNWYKYVVGWWGLVAVKRNAGFCGEVTPFFDTLMRLKLYFNATIKRD